MIKQNEQGSVLLISLMLLIVLTLMTFTISNTVLLQEKLTTSHRDDTLALQVAESALRDAEQRANTFAISEFTIAGNQGLYDGTCQATDASCYLNTVMNSDMFMDANWTDANSRSATTTIFCPHEDACPLEDAYQAGRYKIVVLDKDFDITISGVDQTQMVDNQYQGRDAGSNQIYYLYRIIAMGTGVDAGSRRVIVSHFAAPAP